MLDKLTIEAPKFFSANDPLSQARNSVIQFLEQQWALAEKAAKGEAVERGRRDYFQRGDEKWVLRVRCGAQVVSFGENRTDVICKDHREMMKAIGILLNATKNHEIDEHIKATLDGRKERKPRTKKEKVVEEINNNRVE